MRWCDHVPIQLFSGIIFESMTAFYQKAEQKQQLVFACVEGHCKRVRFSVSLKTQRMIIPTCFSSMFIYPPIPEQQQWVEWWSVLEMGVSSRCSTRPPTATVFCTIHMENYTDFFFFLHGRLLFEFFFIIIIIFLYNALLIQCHKNKRYYIFT